MMNIRTVRFGLALLIGLAVFSLNPSGAIAETYTVSDGDTLYGIARRFSVSVDSLIAANELGDPSRIMPGTVLTIPNVYTVEPGDTLYGIARSIGMTVGELRTLNGLETDTITAGQQLRITSKSSDSRTDSLSRTSSADKTEDVVDNSSTSADDSGVADAGRIAPDAGDATAGDGTAFAASHRSRIASNSGMWPVEGQRESLTGKFPGLRISASRGTEVVAVHDGRVVYAGPHTTFGNVVFVESDEGFIYIYGGQDRITVSVGEEVTTGQPIGTTGISPAEQDEGMIFSVWRDNSFVNPASAPRG